MAETPKKISELQQIENISDDDLLLVSDYDNGKCLSRKMTMQQLFNMFAQKITTNQYILDAINTAAKNAATEAVNTTAISEKIFETIENNSSEILDILDGIKDNTILLDGN